MLGGIVPVPVALGISDEHKHKLLRIAKKLGKPFIYTDRKTLDRIGAFAGPAGEQAVFDGLISRAFFAEQVDDISKAGKVHDARADDMAFIQFSSGSTSEPKGIVLTHRNILVNSHGAGDACNWNENDINLTWMPLTHDMGLIGMHIMMFHRRMQLNLMPTELFIRRPLLWMTFAARKGATITSSPNFGYRHFLKVLGDRDLGDLDLSSIRLIFNGAEPISVELADEFMTRLAPAKLKRTAMYPGVRAGRSDAGGQLPAALATDVRIRVGQSPRAQRRQAALGAAARSRGCAVHHGGRQASSVHLGAHRRR